VSLRIIGCGNLDRGDDAAGLLVARRLRALGVEAAEHSGEGLTLLIYGIEGKQFSLGAPLSPEVSRAVGSVTQELRKLAHTMSDRSQSAIFAERSTS